MGVSTQLVRDGKAVSMYWDCGVLVQLARAMERDQGIPEKTGKLFPEGGHYVFREEHNMQDVIVLPGDIYIASR